MKGEKYSSAALCSLIDSESLGEYLALLLGASKNKLKEYFSKQELARRVSSQCEIEIPLRLVNLNRISPKWSSQSRVRLLEEDSEIIAVSKPAGIHGHPQHYDETETVLNYLRFKRSDIDWESFTEPEKGLLYRLDRETSGLLLFSKSSLSHQNLRANFKSLVKEKFYYALVEGELKHRGEVQSLLEPFGPKGAQMRQAMPGKVAEEASLFIVDAKYFDKSDVSLVKIKLETGLRHQIRVQMKILGHPIIGDQLYGGKVAARLYLHCFKYTLAQSEKSYADSELALFRDYLGVDGRLEVFGDQLLIR